VNRSFGLLALLALAILSIVGVVGVTRPVRIENNGRSTTAQPTATARVTTDAGSLDSLLDGVRLDHQMKHGR
jgi:hypothetical protein